MLTYNMEKPEHIASMEFVPLYYTQVLISYVCFVESAASSKLTYSVPDFSKRILRPGQIPYIDHVDYEFRSEQLRDFPLFFSLRPVMLKGSGRRSLRWHGGSPQMARFVIHEMPSGTLLLRRMFHSSPQQRLGISENTRII